MMDVTEMNETQQGHGGRWIPSEPLVAPFVVRLRDAWEVLLGRARAVRWPRGAA